MKIYINPYKKFHGSFIPEWLERLTGISGGAKICYARLARYAGENGYAFPKIETLAEAIGVSERQVRRYITQLEEINLIEVKQIGFGRANRYYFLEHPSMQYKMSEPYRTDVSTQKRTEAATPYINNHIKQSDINKERKGKIDEVLLYYQEVSGRNVYASGKHTKYMTDLLMEGYTVEQMKKVVDYKKAECSQNTNSLKYFEPVVMFKPDNFVRFLNDANAPKQRKQSGTNNGAKVTTDSKKWDDVKSL